MLVASSAISAVTRHCFVSKPTAMRLTHSRMPRPRASRMRSSCRRYSRNSSPPPPPPPPPRGGGGGGGEGGGGRAKSMQPRLGNLQRLFAPRSVAVVGASAASEKVGHQALVSLRNFSGAVYPVHPKGGEILGRTVYPSLTAVGKPIDMVLFAIPAATITAAVEEAIRCGCRGGGIVSGGFAETGGKGIAAQER